MKLKALKAIPNISQLTKKIVPYEAAPNCYKKDTPNSKKLSTFPLSKNPKIESASKCKIQPTSKLS